MAPVCVTCWNGQVIEGTRRYSCGSGVSPRRSYGAAAAVAGRPPGSLRFARSRRDGAPTVSLTVGPTLTQTEPSGYPMTRPRRRPRSCFARGGAGIGARGNRGQTRQAYAQDQTLGPLLGNRHLQVRTNDLCGAGPQAAQRGLEPLIVIDWSDLKADQSLIAARSLPVGGRSLTLYEEVHPQASWAIARCSTVLQRLAQMLPASAEPIIVADSGFRCRSSARSSGWVGVGRSVAGATRQLKRWRSCKRLFEEDPNLPGHRGVDTQQPAKRDLRAGAPAQAPIPWSRCKAVLRGDPGSREWE